jgi:diacylglycerol O-acyltransferase
MSTSTGSPRPASPSRNGRYPRLGAFEVMYLRLERPAWPGHVGGLAILEGAALLDASGELRLEEIRSRLERRLPAVPELRRRLHFPGPLHGRPLWVDDDRFCIANHVRVATVPAPGGEEQLLEAAARIYGDLLDRRRPLWELWFLTGLDGGRVAALLKLHHAVADGQAVVRIMGSLFDLVPDTPDPAPAAWTPQPAPGGWSLLTDNLSDKMRALGRRAAVLAHPGRVLRGLRLFIEVVRKTAGMHGAARTSLNPPVRAGRRIGFVRLDLAAAKEAAHTRGGKVNDVVLALWAGGLRALLASRGEPVAGVELTVGVMLSTRSTSDTSIDNQVGTVVLPLSVGDADVGSRLGQIILTTREAKDRPRSAAIMGVLAGLASTAVGRHFMVRQRATNVLASNVTGPPVPMFVLGAPILDLLPILDLSANLGLVVCAFSYSGRLYLAVTADAGSFPDLDVLIRGMELDWYALTGNQDGVSDPPSRAGARSCP